VKEKLDTDRHHRDQVVDLKEHIAQVEQTTHKRDRNGGGGGGHGL
jgi:hypothetical protein